MNKSRRPKKKENGQSVVEFLLALFGFFTVFFMFVQMALSLAVANYFQYASFMAARALLPGRPTLKDQIAAAETYLNRMVRKDDRDRFDFLAKGVGDGNGSVKGAFVGPTSRVSLANSDSRRTAWEQGVSYHFEVKMYLLPLFKPKRNEKGTLELETESWLGRDPSVAECEQGLESRRSKSGLQQGLILYDNGC